MAVEKVRELIENANTYHYNHARELVLAAAGRILSCIEMREVSALYAADGGFGDIPTPEWLEQQCGQLFVSGGLSLDTIADLSIAEFAGALLTLRRGTLVPPKTAEPIARRKHTPKFAAREKILTALIALHGFRDGKVRQWGPFPAKEIAKTADVRPASVTNFWAKKFGGGGNYTSYTSACACERIEYLLSFWNGELPADDVRDAERDRLAQIE